MLVISTFFLNGFYLVFKTAALYNFLTCHCAGYMIKY